jgi:hypothetical protein
MTDLRLNPSATLLLVAVVGAGAFAAGRSMPSAPASAPAAIAPSSPRETAREPETDESDPLPPGHVPVNGTGTAGTMPAGHPRVDSMDPSGAAMSAPGAGEPSNGAQGSIGWKAPVRWAVAPNTSSMRLATYRVPKAPGDSDDGELSIMQAGGTVEANADRWVGQFDPAGQKTAKRSTKNVGTLSVTVVEVQGNYAGMGMGKQASGTGWALLGAIVPTATMPYFFKLTGPAKTVAAARGEFDALVASLTPQ